MSLILEKKPNKTPEDKQRIELLQNILKNNLQISKEALVLLLQTPNPTEQLNQVFEQLKGESGFLILPKHLTPKTPGAQTRNHGKAEIQIIANYTENEPVGTIKDISKYFSARFLQYRKYLKARLNNAQSISNVKKAINEKVSIIGIVYDKKKTGKGNIILELEDQTGTITTIINKSELMNLAEDIIFDEVIGISGSASKGVIFVDEITLPEIPIRKEETKVSEEVYAAFLSDIHIGSKKFLYSKFEDMLRFLNGKNNDAIPWETQSGIIDKLKYIFVAGDIVDGVGVYPGQQNELNIKDIYDQYEATARLFSKFPKDIQIVMSPGNHDYVRLAQPQPPIEKDTAPSLYELENIKLISSPGIVKIHPFDSSGGLKTLLYHGTSIDTIVPLNSNLKDGYKHPEKVMLTLLKKRNLSPQYDSGIVTSAAENDPMSIPEDIDIIHTGHVHSNGALNYRGVTMINSGTWQGITEFQKFLGHEPTPARLPILNLKTRQLKIFEF